MTQRIRFHLDESVNNALAVALRQRRIEVTTSGEKGLLGATDERQLAFARHENRVLVTHDDDFLRLHREDISHAGIAYCRQGARTLGHMLRRLVLMWELLEPETMRNAVEYL